MTRARKSKLVRKRSCHKKKDYAAMHHLTLRSHFLRLKIESLSAFESSAIQRYKTAEDELEVMKAAVGQTIYQDLFDAWQNTRRDKQPLNLLVAL